MPRVKEAITVAVLAVCFASYYALAAKSASQAAAYTIMENARTVQQNWQALIDATGLDRHASTGKELSPILVRNHTGLDWLVYGSHVMRDGYKKEFERLNLRPLMEDIHVTNEDSQLHYAVSGARLNSFSVAKDGTTAVFYSEIYQPVLETLLKLYDDKAFSAIGENTGIIRYGKLDDGEFAVGIYLPPTH